MGWRSRAARAGVTGAALALLAACSAPPGAQASPVAETAVHAVSGLQVLPLTVTTAAGKTHRFRVEMARSQQAQMRGLMFRTELGADEGMIFPSVPQTARSFWMKNTPLPLDIIFVGTDGRILNIAEGKPYDLNPVYSVGTTSAVLELARGRASELGIAPGDKVEW